MPKPRKRSALTLPKLDLQQLSPQIDTLRRPIVWGSAAVLVIAAFVLGQYLSNGQKTASQNDSSFNPRNRLWQRLADQESYYGGGLSNPFVPSQAHRQGQQGQGSDSQANSPYLPNPYYHNPYYPNTGDSSSSPGKSATAPNNSVIPDLSGIMTAPSASSSPSTASKFVLGQPAPSRSDRSSQNDSLSLGSLGSPSTARPRQSNASSDRFSSLSNDGSSFDTSGAGSSAGSDLGAMPGSAPASSGATGQSTGMPGSGSVYGSAPSSGATGYGSGYRSSGAGSAASASGFGSTSSTPRRTYSTGFSSLSPSSYSSPNTSGYTVPPAFQTPSTLRQSSLAAPSSGTGFSNFAK